MTLSCTLSPSLSRDQANMDSSDGDLNLTSPSSTADPFTVSTLSIAFSTTLSFNLSTTMNTTSAPQPSDGHDPEITIMVVLGLSLLLAGLAAFLALCRPSGQEGDSEGERSPGESLACGSSLSGEPQLKVWKRLGLYRRSYGMNFRRPPHRRSEHEHPNTGPSPASQTHTEANRMEPHLTVPCLFDYVTEI